MTIEESELLNDVRIARRFEAAGTHDFAVGVYYAHIDETFRRYSASTVQDVSNNSRLLNLVALNAAGQVVGSLTENGVARYGSEFANGYGSQSTFAVYASDEWQITPALRIDAAAVELLRRLGVDRIGQLAALLLLSAAKELHAFGNDAELAALLTGLLVIPGLEFKAAIDESG